MSIIKPYKRTIRLFIDNKRISMKQISILLSILFLSIQTYSQNSLAYTSNCEILKNNKSDYFLISKYPVTNREYITYMMWTNHVYTEYPQIFIETFPFVEHKLNSILYSNDYETSKKFDVIFSYLPSIVKNYMFNPKYIDFPVIGISWKQASKFNKWLSDRYNENKLIKNGYYSMNFNQIGEDCFVSESYIAQQYYGSKVKDTLISWENLFLIPSFRLPTNKEIKYCKNEDLIKSDLISHSKPIDYFLSKWIDSYISIIENSIRLNEFIFSNGEWNSFIISKPINDFNTENLTIVELSLEGERTQDIDNINSLTDINGYKILPKELFQEKETMDFPEKDSLGQMNFIIINKNINGKPILLENYKKKVDLPDKKDNYTIFRYAINLNTNQTKVDSLKLK